MRGSFEKFSVSHKFELKYREHFRENGMIFAKIKHFYAKIFAKKKYILRNAMLDL
jgi:hypothetical protein